MKNKIFLSIIGAGLLWMISCKHEIPAKPVDPALPPVTTTNCSPDTVYFQQKILPIFVTYCSVPDGTSGGCHDMTFHRDDVVLTDYNSIMSTGDIVAGLPMESKAYKKMIDPDPNDVMPPPPKPKLPPELIELVRKWILQGARNNSCLSAACDSVNVTYNQTIRPLMTNKCNGCHGSVTPSSNINLTSYAGVKAIADNGTLWASVKHTGPYPMPKNGPKLSTCELAQINAWIKAGAPNN
jgi:hypothetical protein